MLAELQSWTIRRWTIAAVAAMVVTLLVGLPTDVIPNPVFGRPVDVTWWSYPVLVITGDADAVIAPAASEELAAALPQAASIALQALEQAQIDGANKRQIFWHITLPVIATTP